MGRRGGIPKGRRSAASAATLPPSSPVPWQRAREQHRRARDVPARPRESGDVSQAHRVGMDREHDGNCRGRLPSRLDERRRWGEDHVHMHADKLGHQRGQLIDVLRPSPFDDDAGALDVAEVTQARPQPLTCGTLEGKAEKPDALALCCARAASGQAAAAPPSVAKNFRRSIWLAM